MLAPIHQGQYHEDAATLSTFQKLNPGASWTGMTVTEPGPNNAIMQIFQVDWT